MKSIVAAASLCCCCVLSPPPTAAALTSFPSKIRQRQGQMHDIFMQAAAFDNFEDLDEARRSFEQLLDEHADEIAHHPLVLSSASRRRKQQELELLQSLYESDDALEELVQLWRHEGTASDAQALLDMQQECSSGLVKEEAALTKMLKIQPTWCEPCIRLATVLFYKGRTKESIELAHRARRLKPWHFEVYPLLVMLSLRGPEPSFKDAVRWARLGLPRVHGRRRHEWVARAVEEAQARFQQAETHSARVLRLPETTTEEYMWQ